MHVENVPAHKVLRDDEDLRLVYRSAEGETLRAEFDLEDGAPGTAEFTRLVLERDRDVVLPDVGMDKVPPVLLRAVARRGYDVTGPTTDGEEDVVAEGSTPGEVDDDGLREVAAPAGGGDDGPGEEFLESDD